MKLDEIELTEATDIPENVTVNDVLRMFDAARRGISIMNKLKDVDQRKKHASAIFKNLNKIKGMLMKLTVAVEE
jgi:hypothetical protein